MAKHFKNTIAWLKKADMLYIQPNGNRVDMCDGKMIARVPNYYYETEFMTSSPRFRAVEDGHRYEIIGDHKGIPHEIPRGLDIDEMMDVPKDMAKAKDTGVIFVQDEEQKWYQHLYIREDGESYAVIKEEFHKILEEFRNGNNVYMTNRKSPIFVLPVDRTIGFECCVLPINADIKEKLTVNILRLASEVSVEIK